MQVSTPVVAGDRAFRVTRMLARVARAHAVQIRRAIDLFMWIPQTFFSAPAAHFANIEHRRTVARDEPGDLPRHVVARGIASIIAANAGARLPLVVAIALVRAVVLPLITEDDTSSLRRARQLPFRRTRTCPHGIGIKSYAALGPDRLHIAASDAGIALGVALGIALLVAHTRAKVAPSSWKMGGGGGDNLNAQQRRTALSAMSVAPSVVRSCIGRERERRAVGGSALARRSAPAPQPLAGLRLQPVIHPLQLT